MKKKSPDILWIFAAIFAGGVLFSAVSEGGVENPAPQSPMVHSSLSR